MQLLLDLAAQLVDAELVDEDLDPRAGAVDAQPVLAVEDPEDGLGDLEVLAVVGLDEVVERGRDARHDRGAAADAHLEALHAVADLRADEGDVVDAGDRAVLVGAVNAVLTLRGISCVVGVADEVAHVGAGVGRRVEELVLADAGPRVAGHVADGVAAALAAREAGVAEISRMALAASRSGTWWNWMFCRVVMWPLLSGAYFSTHVGEGLHLLRRDAAERQLHADHLDVGLALAVDALLEAEPDELGLLGLAVEEAARPRCRSRRTRARGSG